MVTKNTPFRQIGNLPLATWRGEFTARASPVSAADVDACYAACNGWAVLLDQAIGETSLTDSNAIAAKNLLGMLDEAGELRVFSAFWKAFAIKYQQLFDPAYKDGAYYPSAAAGISVDAGASHIDGYGLSLAGYKVVYIGGPACLSSGGKTCANGETYDPAKPMSGNVPSTPSINASVASALTRYGRWFPITTPPTTPPSPPTGPPSRVTFGRVPVPSSLKDRQILDAHNDSWDDLGQRTLKGVVLHRMQGTLWGTDTYFNQHAPGLTDWGIGHDTGEILQWNDYLGRGRKGISRNRSPYASGGPGGESGDGIAFVHKYGRVGINRDLTAIEISGSYLTPTTPEVPLTEAGVVSIVAMIAWLADQAHVPYDTFPINPLNGLTFVYWHNEFQGEKPCPGDTVMRATPDMIRRVAALLQRYQTGG